MDDFSPDELEFLSERRLGRIATVDASGQPHVVPVGMWQVNRELGTLDVSGHDFAATRKFRNATAHPQAAFVVDEMVSMDPWRVRAVMVAGPAEAIIDPAGGEGALIRITPERIVSWGLEAG